MRRPASRTGRRAVPTDPVEHAGLADQCPRAGVSRPAASKSAHTASATATGTPSQPAMASTSPACEVCDRAEDDHVQVAQPTRSLDVCHAGMSRRRATSINWCGTWYFRSEYVETTRDRAVAALPVVTVA
jgi:hypothetical protein